MIPLTHLKGQKIAVLGLSRTGQATARAALAGGAQVDVWDDNPDNPTPEGATRLNFPEQGFDDHAALVMSPGIPLTHPRPHNAVLLAKARSIPVIGDIELLWRERQNQNPFIGITGTNGKSTSTALLGHVLGSGGLSPAIGGNIGDAVLSLDPPPLGAPFVLEVSSYQLDLCRSTEFAAAALLNITPDHLSRHGGLSGYIDAKL
ncbi:MAG: Mur ligase family protein, partial [Alphaproteobacteria bacterium]|nr:Mur ligase family protein [Alphaproteobacteria bacterium]